MIELLPCPFCGRKAQYSEESRFHICWVYCPGCGAASGYRDSEAEAIEAWNTRVDTEYGAVPATEENMAAHGWVRVRTCECVAEYGKSPIDGKTIVLHRCSECHEFMRPHMNYCPNCGAKVVD